MQTLIDRIKKDGRNLGNCILKVDGFINHQVAPVVFSGMCMPDHVFLTLAPSYTKGRTVKLIVSPTAS